MEVTAREESSANEGLEKESERRAVDAYETIRTRDSTDDEYEWE